MMPFKPRPEGEENPSEQEYHLEEVQLAGEEPPPAASTPASQLPPEARGETNGGPLGCCFGVSMGLLLGAGIASLSIPVLNHFFSDRGWLALTIQILVVVLAIAGFILLGYIGWKIGRRIFREYEPSAAQQKKMARLEQRYSTRSQHKHV